MVLIFVYGTLKAGEPNHFLMVDDDQKLICEYRGKAQTVDRYPLVIATQRNVPFILYNKGRGHHVVGELYEVDTEHLKILDGLECHPVLYERLDVKVRPLDGATEGSVVDAQGYFLVKYLPYMQDLTMLAEYTSGVNGLHYIPIKNDDSSSKYDSLPEWANEVHTDYT